MDSNVRLAGASLAKRVADIFGVVLEPHGFTRAEARHDTVGVWVRFAADNRAVRIVLCRARHELDVFLRFGDREYELANLLKLAGIARRYDWAHSEDDKLVADLEAIAAIIGTHAEPFLRGDAAFEDELGPPGQ